MLVILIGKNQFQLNWFCADNNADLQDIRGYLLERSITSFFKVDFDFMPASHELQEPR